MKQYESNLFNKGINLDTNPIGMDNHLLTTALNATMITMNGNELVLQNDMGNAKVESAYLPSGFVPVGSKEYGGIVYVASYNPITKQSQIGSFPSPERNITSKEIGESEKVLKKFYEEHSTWNSDNEIIATYDKVCLIEDIVRPGDKFAIVVPDSKSIADLSDNISKNIISLSAVIIDSDGNQIDITDDLKSYTETEGFLFLHYGDPADENDYQIYKNKISGLIFLVEKLIIPAYINCSLSANLNEKNGTVNISFTPSAYDSDGELWEENPNNHLVYKIRYRKSENEGKTYGDWTNVNSESEEYIIYNLSQSGIIQYEIYPLFNYGYISSLKRNGTIDVSLIGTGKVTFLEFLYYNDTVDGYFELDYGISSYLADTLKLSKLQLEYRLVTGNTSENTLGIAKYIDLDNSNYFGSYSELIDYTDTGILTGKMYLCRLKSTVTTYDTSGKSIGNDKIAYSDFYWLITSSLTNSTYMKSNNSMFNAGSANTIDLDTSVNWNSVKLLVNTVSTEETPNTTSPMSSTSRSLYVYELKQDSTVKNLYSCETTLEDVDGNFPFEYELTSKITKTDPTEEYTIEYTKEGSYIIQNCPKPIINYSYSSDTNLFNVEVSSNIYSRFESPLDGSTHNYTNSNMAAIVPYISTNSYYFDTIEKLLGNSPYTQGSTYKTSSWFSWATWEGSKNARHREVFIVAPSSWYSSIWDFGYIDIPGQGSGNDIAYGIFDTTSTNAYWKYYCAVFNDYINNQQGYYPEVLLWQGYYNGASCMYDYYDNRSLGGVDYAMVMFKDTNDEWYPCGVWSDPGTLLTSMLNTFSRIYYFLEGQTINYQYYKCNDSLYAYTNQYDINISFTLTSHLQKNLTYDNTGASFKVDSTTLYYPIFNIIDSQSSKNYEITLSSEAIDDKVYDYTLASPNLGTIFLKYNIDSEDPSKTGVVESAWNPEKGIEESINTRSVYYLRHDGKIISCDKYTADLIFAGDTTNRSTDYCLVNAFHNKYLKFVLNSRTNRYSVFVNKQYASSALSSPSNVYIANNSKQTKLRDIASNHILNFNTNGYTLFGANKIT